MAAEMYVVARSRAQQPEGLSELELQERERARRAVALRFGKDDPELARTVLEMTGLIDDTGRRV